MNVEIRPITVQNYIAFYKEEPKRTIRGYCFFVDDEIVGVFGALLYKEGAMLFSDVKEGFNASPIIIWRWAKRALTFFDNTKQPLYATSKKSGRFLESLGFVWHGNNIYEYLR